MSRVEVTYDTFSRVLRQACTFGKDVRIEVSCYKNSEEETMTRALLVSAGISLKKLKCIQYLYFSDFQELIIESNFVAYSGLVIFWMQICHHLLDDCLSEMMCVEQ